MRWQWPFVSRSEHDAVCADRERIRGERDQFAKDRDTQRYAAETAARQFTDADATNRRLEDHILECGRRLTRFAESDPEYAAALERRITRLRTVGERIHAAYKVEKQRADRLSSYLDDGDLRAIKQWEKRVEAHNAWKPPADRERRPVDGADGRPTHPAVELRRALERCRALEARLTKAEGRKRVAS